MIDPIKGSLEYKTPSTIRNFDNLVFGIPVSIMPDVADPTNLRFPLVDPNFNKTTKIEAHKRDIYWRRRGMKRHRYQRWQKRNETLLAYKDAAKQKKKEIRLQDEIANIWKEAGLEKEPPTLSEEEEKKLAQKWRTQGIWSSALTAEEIFTFASPPEPKDKKTLPVKIFNIPR